MAKLIERSEISGEGIDVLAEKGKFGLVAEIFPRRGAGWAERNKVAPERCWALAHDGGEVVVFAAADGLKLIRLDDVGKLSR